MRRSRREPHGAVPEQACSRQSLTITRLTVVATVQRVPSVRPAVIMGDVKAAEETNKARWQRETLEPALKKAPERAPSPTTISGWPIERLYTAEDIAAIDPVADI